MFEVYEDVHKEVYNAFKLNKLAGTSIPVYLDKSKTSMRREKVACAFLYQSTLNSLAAYENTVINILLQNQGKRHLDLLISNKVLTYNALIALIYCLRVNRFIACDIANVAYKKEYSLISIEGLDLSSSTIKISVPDELHESVITDISEVENRKYDKFIVRNLAMYGDTKGSMDVYNETIIEAIQTTFEINDTFKVESNTKFFYILENRLTTFVVYKNSAVLVSKSIDVDFDTLLENLVVIGSNNNITFKCTMSSSVLMI